MTLYYEDLLSLCCSASILKEQNICSKCKKPCEEGECVYCDSYGEVVKNVQQDLHSLKIKYKKCPECSGNKIISLE